jgi:membrane-associated HD superfamily phosphohydrolase
MALQQADDLRTRATVGSGFFVALVVSVVYLFGAKRVFQRRLRNRDVIFLGIMLGLELGLLVIADVASPWVVAAVPGVQPAMLAYALPIAFGPMVVRLTLPPDVSLLFALVVALLGGVVVEGGMAWSVTTTLGAMTGVAVVSGGPRRLTLILAGLAAGVVGSPSSSFAGPSAARRCWRCCSPVSSAASAPASSPWCSCRWWSASSATSPISASTGWPTSTSPC